mgnify:CR=1 FL=1
MDGIPVPFAPYGQPQLSLAPISMGNMDAVDVVRGGGAVRYGPQNVGGVVNFVTRAIPDEPTVKGGLQTETSPSSSHDGFKSSANLLAGGTMLGAFFIATDPVSGATTPRGKLIFAAGIALIAWLIRNFGAYPEGIAFGVLLMNMCVPLLDMKTQPRVFGHRHDIEGGGK